ncbi:phage tail tip lysozyme [Lactococcus lactis]|uniref:Phage tail tip lysozyme n=1 Tax=Lactococcus lactis TaxID=1358 RepID=A0AAP5P4F4_9LACT|nr:phage tail tip lysozyme [Lactococcus lactis]MDT2858534.1 phage tail tip lysozyme [Lactococcus lactis]MDT2866665.1 phage tail tip lysozyme [Lactococcus lactis]MDT2872648.1 phage tail tip lysozyme [Lactococcus lactis]MDT2877556.1 phage tail tip lysozyme [Lactococcus lactis]MDT2880058.1 phage tail tip lysozyme [Lactococcus lactis]
MKKKLSVVFVLGALLLPVSVTMMGVVGGTTDASAGMVSVDTTGMDEAHKIWVQGHQYGGTDEGVAALMGNLQHESTLKANIIQSNQSYDESKAMDSSLGGYALGLAQWDAGRRVNLLNFAKSENANWNDTGLQLNFLFNHDGSDSTLIKQLIKGTDINQTTENIMRQWERAGATDSLGQRQADAKYWLNAMKNESTSGGVATSPGATIPTGWTIDKSINTGNYIADSYSYKQCTWWVYNRAKEFGISYGAYMGNGADWQNQAGYSVTTTPTLHSAVSFSAGQMVGDQWQADSQYGHVAFVEAIHSDGSVLISQSGTGFSTEYTYQVLSATQASQLHYVIGK